MSGLLASSLVVVRLYAVKQPLRNGRRKYLSLAPLHDFEPVEFRVCRSIHASKSVA